MATIFLLHINAPAATPVGHLSGNLGRHELRRIATQTAGIMSFKTSRAIASGLSRTRPGVSLSTFTSTRPFARQQRSGGACHRDVQNATSIDLSHVCAIV